MQPVKIVPIERYDDINSRTSLDMSSNIHAMASVMHKIGLDSDCNFVGSKYYE